MSDHGWKLVVEFDSLEKQQQDPVSEYFVLGDAAEFYRFALQQWGVEAEDAEDDIKWDGDTVTVFADVLDYLHDIVGWVMSQTIPKKLTLERVEG